jgi:FlaG/FlaF family flagellin (archaellin)
MYRGNSSRVFPIILVIVVIAIAVAALISIGRVIFGGGGSQQPQIDVGKQALLNTDTGHSVQMTVRGPIVADENFRSYRISVDTNGRSLTTYSGYLDQPIDSKSLSNNTQAYEQFVYALDRANLMKGTAFEGDKDDTRGICATGRVYEFEVIDSGSTVKRLWTSTCKGSPGSFKGSVTQVQNLFLQQIPDNRDLLKTVNL